MTMFFFFGSHSLFFPGLSIAVSERCLAGHLLLQANGGAAPPSLGGPLCARGRGGGAVAAHQLDAAGANGGQAGEAVGAPQLEAAAAKSGQEGGAGRVVAPGGGNGTDGSRAGGAGRVPPKGRREGGDADGAGRG